MKHLVLAAALALSPGVLPAGGAEGLAAPSPWAAGHRTATLAAPHHGRALDLALWYPAAPDVPVVAHGGNAVFLPVAVALDAAPAEGRFPVVVLSHGLGGHYRSLAWLAAGLARSGAVVVAVNHPNSTVFDFDMQAGLEHWTRVQDLSLALDHLVSDAAFAHVIDPEAVAAVGFSYGGWTALSLGGLRGNLAGYVDHCVQAPTRHCRDIAAAGADLSALPAAQWNGDHADPRIRRVAAIDPGLTHGLTDADAAALRVPVLLIQLGAGADRLDATDLSAAGSDFTARLARSGGDVALVEIAPAAHFSVLPLCTDRGAEVLRDDGDDPVCTDPAGAERAAIHAEIEARLRAWLGLDG